MVLSGVHSAQSALNLVRTLEVAEKAEVRYLCFRKHLVEASAIGQGAYVPANVKQIEAGEVKARKVYGLEILCRWALEHRKNVEARLTSHRACK